MGLSKIELAQFGLTALLACGCGSPSEPDRALSDAPSVDPGPPNIVLIVADELPPVGGQLARLAESGVRFPAASSAPASPVIRSSLLTGVSPALLGLAERDEHLSSTPPVGVRVFPELLRRAGYFTVRNGPLRHSLSVPGVDPAVDGALGQPGLLGAWDVAGPDADWRREPGEPCTVSFGCGGYTANPSAPFFTLFNVEGSSGAVDHGLEAVLSALERDGLSESTAVIAFGIGGTDASAVARWPGRFEAGASGDQPLAVRDVAPTILALAGAPVPSYMEGRVALGATGTSARSSMRSTTARSVAPWTDGTPPVAATPRGYPTGGVFHVAPRVDLSCDTEDATIIYTTERVAPFHWRLYTGPFRMRFWTLRVQCGRLGYQDSEVVTYDFDIE